MKFGYVEDTESGLAHPKMKRVRKRRPATPALQEHPKPVRVRMPEFLAFVAKQRCIICEWLRVKQQTPTQAAHVALGKGLSSKSSDAWCIPLCLEHHQGASGIDRMTNDGWSDRWNLPFGGPWYFVAVMWERFTQELSS